MYKCEICEKIAPPSVPSVKLTVKTRNTNYPHRTKVNKFKITGRKKIRDDAGGSGSQIVNEITVCPDCASQKTPVLKN